MTEEEWAEIDRRIEAMDRYFAEKLAASGTEAQRATTAKHGVVHDGPAPKADAQTPVHTPPPHLKDRLVMVDRAHRSSSDRAGGPADLSRCASQPEALIPLRKRKRGDGLCVCRCGQTKHPNSNNCRDCYQPLWRPDQDATLCELVAAGWEYNKIARKLHRSGNACRSRAMFLGVKHDPVTTLENRKRGRERFYANAAKSERRMKRLMKSYTPLDRAIRAEELRQRNVAGTMGMKGKHHTPEVCARISAANKGRAMAEETKRKISEARKAYFKAKRDGGQAAYLAAMLADEGRLRRLDDDKCHNEERIWCSQCERQVTTARAFACGSPFCKAKELAA